MPQLAAVVINDGQATPVAKTFTPVRIIGGEVAEWTERSATVVDGFKQLTTSMKYNRTTKTTKVTLKIVDPVLETVGNASTGYTPPAVKAFECGFSAEFWIPGRASLQNRKDILAYAKNALALAVTTSMVQDLEAVY